MPGLRIDIEGRDRARRLQSLIDAGRDATLLFEDIGGSPAFRAARDEVQVGSNLIYAATHQFGDPARNIPARPFLGLSTDDRTEILALAQAWLEAAANRP